MKSTLKIFAFVFALAWLLALNGLAVDVQIDLRTMVSGNVVNRPVSITNALSVVNGVIIPANIYRTNSGSSGVFYMSNMVGGITYTLEVQMPLVASTVRFTPPVTNALVLAADYTSVTTNNASGSVAYSQGAANSIFATKTNPTFSGNITWTNNYGSNKVLAIGTDGKLILTDGAATVGGGNGDVTTAQLLTTSNGLRTLSFTIGTNATNFTRNQWAALTNLVDTLFNAARTNTLTVHSNIDLTLAGNPPWLRWYWSSTNEYTLGDVVNDSVVLNYIRNQQLLQTARLQVLGGLTANNITNTGTFYGNGAGLTNLPGVGAVGQYVTNYNGKVTNSFLIVSPDGDHRNGFLQNGAALEITNSVNGVVATYDEDAQSWTFAGTLFGNGSGLTGVSGAGGISTNSGSGTNNYFVGPTITNATSIHTTGRLSAATLSVDQLNVSTLLASNLSNGKLLMVGSDGIVTNAEVGSGLSLSSGTLSATASGSGGGRGSSNVVVSSTNEVYLSWSESSEFRVYLLTNANITFTNINGISNLHGYVFFQQDTNGSRTVRLRNAHGLIQTNESLAVTATANALDLLEVKRSFFPTNLLAWWPKDFQPRIAFTNSLASGGGGGGGGWQDVNSSGATDANGNIESSDLHWTPITLISGTATKARLYIRQASNPEANVKVGLYNSGGSLVASGTSTIPGTGYLEITFSASASVSAATYYLAWIGDSGATDNQIGYQNGTGTLSFKAAVTAYTLPGTLPTEDGNVARKYAVGVWVE